METKKENYGELNATILLTIEGPEKNVTEFLRLVKNLQLKVTLEESDIDLKSPLE